MNRNIVSIILFMQLMVRPVFASGFPADHEFQVKYLEKTYSYGKYIFMEGNESHTLNEHLQNQTVIGWDYAPEGIVLMNYGDSIDLLYRTRVVNTQTNQVSPTIKQKFQKNIKIIHKHTIDKPQLVQVSPGNGCAVTSQIPYHPDMKLYFWYTNQQANTTSVFHIDFDGKLTTNRICYEEKMVQEGVENFTCVADVLSNPLFSLPNNEPFNDIIYDTNDNTFKVIYNDKEKMITYDAATGKQCLKIPTLLGDLLSFSDPQTLRENANTIANQQKPLNTAAKHLRQVSSKKASTPLYDLCKKKYDTTFFHSWIDIYFRLRYGAYPLDKSIIIDGDKLTSNDFVFVLSDNKTAYLWSNSRLLSIEMSQNKEQFVVHDPKLQSDLILWLFPNKYAFIKVITLLSIVMLAIKHYCC